MTFAIISATVRLILFLIVTYKLVFWKHMLNQVESLGLGLIGGSSFLTIPVILDIHKEGTPFDIWAGLLLSIGMACYLIGRLSRHIRHQHRNDDAIKRAEEHLIAKGKL